MSPESQSAKSLAVLFLGLLALSNCDKADQIQIENRCYVVQDGEGKFLRSAVGEVSCSVNEAKSVLTGWGRYASTPKIKRCLAKIIGVIMNHLSCRGIDCEVIDYSSANLKSGISSVVHPPRRLFTACAGRTAAAKSPAATAGQDGRSTKCIDTDSKSGLARVEPPIGRE